MIDNDNNDNNDNNNINPTTTSALSSGLTNSFMLPLQIWRYVNHIPLLDSDDDALSCGVTAAVRGIHWNRFEV